jgi:hypothetical protein
VDFAFAFGFASEIGGGFSLHNSAGKLLGFSPWENVPAALQAAEKLFEIWGRWFIEEACVETIYSRVRYSVT